jgi:prolactin regulatory element-binding protein
VVRCGPGGHLSEEITKLNVGSDAPYRMAMHPSGRALVLGLTMGGIKRVDVTPPPPGSLDPPQLSLAGGEFDAAGKRFGAIKCMSFSSDGRWLALGGEDGSLEVVEWPSLTSKRRWQPSTKAVRNVDFSAAHADGVLAAVDESGACVLWDVASGEEVGRLQPPNDLPRATFFRCKTAVDEDGIAFYTPVKFKGQGYVLRWRQDEEGNVSLEHRSQKPVTPAPICGFETSPSGRYLAAVTPDGDQCVISARTLRVVKYRKGAHLTFATAVAFSPDDRAVLSTGSDASATLTVLRESGGSFVDGAMGGAGTPWVILLVAALVALVAAMLGMLRRLALEAPEEVEAVVHWLPSWIRHLVLASTA